ncbi:MAG: tripartite tricarboxylate transporter TctB family protein [Hyphomicrobiales bacterium]
MDSSREGRADRLSGIFWILFGLVIIIYSASMDIAAHLGATYLTGPGLVPMLLGGALCILGLVLVLRGTKGRVLAFLSEPGTVSDRRALAALTLMLIYALGMVGRIDFGVATFLFITAFIVILNLPVAGAGAIAKLTAKAAVTAAITSVVVIFVFQELFYIRVP